MAITALLPRQPPAAGTTWTAYRDATLTRLDRVGARLAKMGIDTTPMIASAGLQLRAAPDQLRHLEATGGDQIQFLELDPVLRAELLDDISGDVGLPDFHAAFPGLDGAGIGVAVLDSGIDVEHPHLAVAASSSTCAESDTLPGLHGTHCGGIVASQDAHFRGVAPGVRLVNVKVGRANGSFQPGDISRGFDIASADDGVDIISVSLGLNHLPWISANGQGWSCPRGVLCQLCRGVEIAIRRAGHGGTFDTELCCPGQFRGALTVGSVAKRTWLPAPTSSRGPSSSGVVKPDLVAPGVNVTSTIPVPRGAGGKPDSAASRADLFARQSGTSMATPVVAGLAALTLQRARSVGRRPTPAALKRTLRASAHALPFGPYVTGEGLSRAR